MSTKRIPGGQSRLSRYSPATTDGTIRGRSQEKLWWRKNEITARGRFRDRCKQDCAQRLELIYYPIVLSSGRQIAKINDYAAVGDCRAAALVSRYGSVDWLCWPRFDSPSIFAAILDKDKGGCWSISPVGPSQLERAYIRDSNVLETYFIAPAGRATLTDLMPVASEEFKRQHMVPDHEFLRQVACTEGAIKLEVVFSPRPYYGAKDVQIHDLGAQGLRIDVGRGAYFLRSSVKLRIDRNDARTEMLLGRGDVLYFSLSYSEESPAVCPHWERVHVRQSIVP
jgi:hypothetical protein